MRASKLIKPSILALMLILLTACSGEDPLSPEQQVKTVLENIEAAAEERSLAGMMRYVSKDYRDHNGYSKNEIQRFAQMQFIARQNINIFSLIRSLEIIDGIAAVEMSVAMAGRDVDLSNQANRLRADTLRFSIVLEQENQDWLIKSVAWERGW